MLRSLTAACAVILVLPPLAIAQSAPASSATLSQTMSRAAATFKSAQTLRIQFEQKWTNGLTGRTGASRGELLRKSPNRFSINFTEPKGDRIVSDGKTLWMYLPSSAPGQAIKSSAMESGGDPLSDVLLAPLDRYTFRDAGTAKIEGHATQGVMLTPKATGSAFTKATVWVDTDDSAVRRVEVTDPSGMTRRVTITKVTKNGDIPNSAFTFTPPAKTRVVDRTR